MPESSRMGASLAEPIDLDAFSSDSDVETVGTSSRSSRSSSSAVRRPPARPSQRGRVSAAAWSAPRAAAASVRWRAPNGAMSRDSSDSPPPIITSSSIVHSYAIPQTARRARGNGRAASSRPTPSTTQRRLLAAVRPQAEEGGSSAISTSLTNAATASTPTFAPAATIQTSPATNPSQRSFVLGLQSTAAAIASSQPLRMETVPNHELVLRHVVALHDFKKEQETAALQNGRLIALPIATHLTQRPSKYELRTDPSSDIAAQWQDKDASDLQQMVLDYGLHLIFRPFKNGRTMHTVVEIWCQRGGIFHIHYLNRIKSLLKADLTIIRGAFLSFTVPRSLKPALFTTLPRLVRHLPEMTSRVPPMPQQPPRRTTVAQGSMSVGQHAVQAIAGLANAFGMSGVASVINPAVLAQMTPAPLPMATGYASSSRIPGAWDDVLHDRDMLMAATDGDDLPDTSEPMDADMQAILNEMADGAYVGSDALASLYGNSGVDVAKLTLYSDEDMLRKRGLKTRLHPHQLQGLQWMIKAEHRRVSTIDRKDQGLWQTREDGRGRKYYFNLATRKCKREAPILPRGGINSDSMGLGKTIQIIATCLADRRRVTKGVKPPAAEPNQIDITTQGQGASTSVRNDQNKAEEEEEEEESEEDYFSDSGEEDEDEGPAKRLRRPAVRTSISDSETEDDSPPSKRSKHSTTPADTEDTKSSTTEDEKDSVVFLPDAKRKALKAVQEDEKKVLVKVNGIPKRESPDTRLDEKGHLKKSRNGEDKIQYNETTLVICPLSVLQNWTGQVDQHCDRKVVRYYTYHGESAKKVRHNIAFRNYLGRHNFVFTTYDTVRMEYKVMQDRRKAIQVREEKLAERARKEAEGLSAEEREDQKLSTERDEKEGVRQQSVYKPKDFDCDIDDAKDIREREEEKGKAVARQRYPSDDSFIASDDDYDWPIRNEPRDTPLFEVNWRRIVLDEAHTCRNPKTALYNAICELKGERRWAVTGTPIVNSTKDLGALAAWCGLHPFASDLKEWSMLIERPLKRPSTSERAASLLRKVVTSICLRRHKSMKNAQGDPIVRLPPVYFYRHTIPLTVSDREYYAKCEAACREHLRRWLEEGNLTDHRSAILLFLLRLRQMSCHRRLIGSQLLEEIQSGNYDSVDKNRVSLQQLTQKDIEELQQKLKVHVEMNDDCPICMEGLLGKDPVMTPCGHPFCKACLSSIVNRTVSAQATCPMDRRALPSMEGMIELPLEASDNTDTEEFEMFDVGSERTSAKVSECLKIIRATLKRDPTEKILVFSNFVSFLNLIGEELKVANMSYARFNGTLDVKRRDVVLERFKKPITPPQSTSILENIIRIEEEMRREMAAQKAAAEEEEAAAVEAAAVSTDESQATSLAVAGNSSSSLLTSLRGIDATVSTSKRVDSKGKGKGKQRAQDDDVIGANPSILLISMGCGALGLNLTAASTVILMDPWWQSSAEQQSIDRTHRIGQERDVKVFQLICENTVEARVLEIQAAKEGLTETAFSGLRGPGAASDKRERIQTSIKDLGRLFGFTQTEVNDLTRLAVAQRQ